MSRTSESASRIIQTVEQRTSALRSEDEISRIVRIVRETSGSRTEAEAAERIFRMTERNVAVLREAEQSRTTDSVSNIIRAAERRERNIQTQSELSRAIRIIRETSGNRTKAEATERILRTAERNDSMLRETAAYGATDSVTRIFRETEQRANSLRMEDEASRIIRIIREAGGSRTEAEAAERIFRQREEAERILRRTEPIQAQRERGGFGVESGDGYLEIAHNPSHFGGYGRESGDTFNITLSPVYHIEAGVDHDALMPTLRQNDKELRDFIIQTMKDYEYNKRRRAWV